MMVRLQGYGGTVDSGPPLSFQLWDQPKMGRGRILAASILHVSSSPPASNQGSKRHVIVVDKPADKYKYIEDLSAVGYDGNVYSLDNFAAFMGKEGLKHVSNNFKNNQKFLKRRKLGSGVVVPGGAAGGSGGAAASSSAAAAPEVVVGSGGGAAASSSAAPLNAEDDADSEDFEEEEEDFGNQSVGQDFEFSDDSDAEDRMLELQEQLEREQRQKKLEEKQPAKKTGKSSAKLGGAASSSAAAASSSKKMAVQQGPLDVPDLLLGEDGHLAAPALADEEPALATTTPYSGVPVDGVVILTHAEMNWISGGTKKRKKKICADKTWLVKMVVDWFNAEGSGRGMMIFDDAHRLFKPTFKPGSKFVQGSKSESSGMLEEVNKGAETKQKPSPKAEGKAEGKAKPSPKAKGKAKGKAKSSPKAGNKAGAGKKPAEDDGSSDEDPLKLLDQDLMEDISEEVKPMKIAKAMKAAKASMKRKFSEVPSEEPSEEPVGSSSASNSAKNAKILANNCPSAKIVISTPTPPKDLLGFANLFRCGLWPMLNNTSTKQASMAGDVGDVGVGDVSQVGEDAKVRIEVKRRGRS